MDLFYVRMSVLLKLSGVVPLMPKTVHIHGASMFTTLLCDFSGHRGM
jgi:hypothetical protein